MKLLLPLAPQKETMSSDRSRDRQCFTLAAVTATVKSDEQANEAENKEKKSNKKPMCAGND